MCMGASVTSSISAQTEIKSRGCFRLCNYLAWLSLIGCRNLSSVWARKKSASALLRHTILCHFIASTGDAVAFVSEFKAINYRCLSAIHLNHSLSGFSLKRSRIFHYNSLHISIYGYGFSFPQKLSHEHFFQQNDGCSKEQKFSIRLWYLRLCYCRRNEKLVYISDRSTYWYGSGGDKDTRCRTKKSHFVKRTDVVPNIKETIYWFKPWSCTMRLGYNTTSRKLPVSCRRKQREVT